MTKVYAWGVPTTQNMVAGDGSELTLEWLPYATGEQDADVVRNYLKLLRKLDSKTKSKAASQTQRAAPDG